MARPGHNMDPFPWSLTRIASLTAKGDLSPQTVTAAAADAIRAREPSVRAWSALALEPARKRAKSLTKELGAQGPRSPLHGVPYGAKDIFDSAGIPTEWGSATQRGRIPGRDCDLVRRLESLGCVLVGKTETTAFAYYDTGPTRNPRDLARTPGGSSSGSAAAVAAGMVPLAFGTQTQGSVLRPASFCGIAGFKPTFGLLPLGGVMAFAPTLDHAGVFAATAADIDVTWRSLGFKSRGVPASAITVLDWPPGGSLEATMQNAFRSAVRALGEMGVGVERVERPAFFDLLPDALHTVMAYECAREHAERYRQHGRDMGAKLSALLDEGLSTTADVYRSAIAALESARTQYARWIADHPLMATPAALGPAPLGLGSSGDPRCNAPFTALGVPAISIPMPRASPPMGLQLTASSNGDAALLASAAEFERLLSATVQ